MFRVCSLVAQKIDKLFWIANEIAKAPVAQWIEQRFPKPQVACSIHAGGAVEVPAKQGDTQVLQVLLGFGMCPILSDYVRLCTTFRGARAGQSGAMVAPTEHLLAMKVRATRALRDADDIRLLLKRLHISSMSGVLKVVEQYFPDDPLSERTRLLLEDILLTV